jgi:dTDP-4-amino-4,6-dideoxygalactose transaminase
MTLQAIPVMRPKLPVTERIAPYMRQIDRARLYSNFGPLARSLESRLATCFGTAEEGVVSVANATVGLTLALMAQHPEPGSLCAIPAWTFAATPHAVTQAGLVPYFVDVDPGTWAFDPERLSHELSRAPGKVSAVMPVAPFGQPIDVSLWDQFRARTGLAVVIDAAAGFDSLVSGRVPSVVSLHATKVLGIGEGGCVVSRDIELIKDLRARANFGFFQSRESRVSATNAKLSEYHAAIGLAALDEWDVTRTEWVAVADAYNSAFAGLNRVQLQSGFGDSWIASTCVVDIADAGADRVERALNDAKIETRRWWGRGAHDHPATHRFPRSSLSVTETLARSTIGLPFYRDLELSAIGRIAECVHSVA